MYRSTAYLCVPERHYRKDPLLQFANNRPRRVTNRAVIFPFRYLIDHGANVSSVNNDGELAIDISESDEMEELLQKEIEVRGIDCEESRNTEERSVNRV